MVGEVLVEFQDEPAHPLVRYQEVRPRAHYPYLELRCGRPAEQASRSSTVPGPREHWVTARPDRRQPGERIVALNAGGQSAVIDPQPRTGPGCDYKRL